MIVYAAAEACHPASEILTACAFPVLGCVLPFEAKLLAAKCLGRLGTHTWLPGGRSPILRTHGPSEARNVGGPFPLLVVRPAAPHDAGQQSLTRHTKDPARSSPVGVVSHGPRNYIAMRSVSRTLPVWPLVRCRIRLASSSVPGTPAPTPISPSPSLAQHIHPDQIAASIARYRYSTYLSEVFCLMQWASYKIREPKASLKGFMFEFFTYFPSVFFVNYRYL